MGTIRQIKHIYSGGAEGADKLWVELAVANGWSGHHIIVGKRKYSTPSVAYYKLSKEEYAYNLDMLMQIAEKLLRGDPMRYKDFVRKLLVRNISIVNRVEALYGVGYLEPSKKNVAGGTGWGFAQAIIQNKPCFIFDQALESWFTYDLEKSIFSPTLVSKIEYDRIAGVGSRELKPIGIKAIEHLWLDSN